MNGDTDSVTPFISHQETVWKTTSRFRTSSMVSPRPLRPRHPTVGLTSLTSNSSISSGCRLRSSRTGRHRAPFILTTCPESCSRAFVLACDMRFAARESAIFGQFEPAFGVIPGAGGAQHLSRLMGRAGGREVLVSAEDYDADLAERYGWINRALPAVALGEFVRSLAHRIAGFPAAAGAALTGPDNGDATP